MSDHASYSYASAEDPALAAPPDAEAPTDPAAPADAKAQRPGVGSFLQRLRMPGQTGVKLAVVASFLVLVAVMVVNKVRHRDAAQDETKVAQAPAADHDEAPSPSGKVKSRPPAKPTHLALPTRPAADTDGDAPPADPTPAKVADRAGSSMPDVPDEPPADPRPAEKVTAMVASVDDPPPADEPPADPRPTDPVAKLGDEGTAPPSPPAELVETPPRQEPARVASAEVPDLPDLGAKPQPAATAADAPPTETRVADAHADAPPTTKTGPIPAGTMPPFDPPPSGADDAIKPAATEGPKEWVRLPNAMKRRKSSSDPFEDLQAVVPTPAPPAPKATPAAAADPEAEVITHKVRPGEDFGTIARYYYDSPRFRRALWSANRKRVPSIDDLRPGTTIRVPMPEALDPALIPAPGEETADDLAEAPAPRPKSAPGRDGFARRAPRAKSSLVPMSDEPERRPSYTVHQGDTLRSIARDTLNDPHREGEILELNRDAIGDPRGKLPQGLRLALPDDALTGRRVR